MNNKNLRRPNRDKCRLIIHGASSAAAAIGAGFAQLPVSDSAILLPLQISMVVAIGREAGIEITDSAARGLALGSVATVFGRTASQLIVGWIPIIGNATNAITAAGLTEAIGWSVLGNLERQMMTSDHQVR